MVSLLVVQHDDECPPALFADWLGDAGLALDVRRPYAGDVLPALEGYAGLLVLGGPMGADDDPEHAWLGPTKDLLRDAAGSGVPTLGICLGHQLAASALGGRVHRNPRGQQLGLQPVGWTAEAASDPLFASLTTPRRGVHWNNDVVSELPAGAVALAVTDRQEVQAARYAPDVWGVQWHPEADRSVVAPWAASDRGSHEALGIDQEALLRDLEAAQEQLEADWRPLADGFAAVVGAARRRSVGEVAVR